MQGDNIVVLPIKKPVEQSESIVNSTIVEKMMELNKLFAIMDEEQREELLKAARALLMSR